MSSQCLSAEQIRALLAGELAGLVEEQAILHLECCPHCERVAAELSEEPQTRQLVQRSQQRPAPPSWDLAELADLRSRLLAYGRLQRGEATVADLVAPGKAAGPRSAIAEAPRAGKAATSAAGGAVADSAARTTRTLDDRSLCGQRLGPLEVLRVLGSGAFGVVFEAYDHALHRRVALKVARPSVLADPALRARFFREAQALARLEHPAIVPVYGAEEREGCCYLILAFCPGPTLEQYLAQQSAPLAPRQAVALVLPLVEAVGHAHQRGILHRDIKPGNILLADREAESAESLRPRLTDFGLAKLMEEESSDTPAGLVLGTATYMAPEQAAGHTERIGPASDLYALGVVLYELLTKRVPIEGRSMLETLRRLLIETPQPPSAYQSGIDRDLDAIVLRCLAKSPDGRYPSAEALAEDLRDWLAGRPVRVCQRPKTREVWRLAASWGRPLAAASLAVLLLGLLGAIAWMTRVNRGLRQQFDQVREEQGQGQQDADRQATLLAAQQYAATLISMSKAAEAQDHAFVAQQLEALVPAKGAIDPRGFEWHFLHALTTRLPDRESMAAVELYQTVLAPSGRTFAAVGKDGSLRQYEAATLALQSAWPTGQGETNGVDYAPDGQQIATAGDDGTLCVFDAANGARRLRIAAHRGQAFGVRYYDQGRRLASCGQEPTIRLWDAATGKPLGVLEGHAPGHRVETLACAANGRYLASAGSDAIIVIWDLETQTAAWTLKGHERPVSSLAFSPDGRHLVSGALDRSVSVWDVSSGRHLARATFLNPVQCVAVVDGGNVVVVGDRAGCLYRFRLARVPPDAPQATLAPDTDHAAWYAHGGRVWSLCPAREGDAWFTTGAGGWVRAWTADRLAPAQRTLVAPPGQLLCDLAYTPDGAQLLVLDETSGITVYDAHSLRPLRRLTDSHAGWSSLHLLSGRDEVAAGNAQGMIAIWNYRQAGPPRRTIDLGAATVVGDLAYEPATQRLAVLPLGLEEVRLYRVEDGALAGRIPTGNHWAMALAPDGRHLSVDLPHRLVTFELASGREVRAMVGHAESLFSVAYSPDGTLLAAIGDDRRLHLWSSQGALLTSLAPHPVRGQQVAFSSDGRRLFSADMGGGVQVVDVATRVVLYSFTLPCDLLCRIAISPDQQHLAAIVERNQQRQLIVLGPSRPATSAAR
jgi:WD40 repeat protein/tRNA A-37 threonylcarbamoyl transferase component Bud32